MDARDRILEAALNLFSKDGFHATTTRKIAQKAEVNEVTLFRLFKSKMILFHDILERVRSVGFDSNRLLGLSLSPEDSIRYFVENTIETLEDHPQEFRILQHAVLDEVEGFEERFIHDQQKEVLKYLAEAFQKLQQAKRILSEENPVLLANLLMSLTVGAINQRIIMRHSSMHTFKREALSNSIIKLFLTS